MRLQPPWPFIQKSEVIQKKQNAPMLPSGRSISFTMRLLSASKHANRRPFLLAVIAKKAQAQEGCETHGQRRRKRRRRYAR